MHSYSGMPGTEAPLGLTKQDREKSGAKGGVIRLVYVAALAMPEGPGVVWDGGAEIPGWMDVHGEVCPYSAVLTDPDPFHVRLPWSSESFIFFSVSAMCRVVYLENPGLPDLTPIDVQSEQFFVQS
jgi:hypothetical protein